MNRFFSSALAALLVGGVCRAANVEFRYTLLVNDETVADSVKVFGRSEDATEGIDEGIDMPMIPSFDGGGVTPTGPVDDFYFRAQASLDGNADDSNAYTNLYTDIRSASKSATTWTLCTNTNPVALSWKGQYFDGSTTINSALAAGNGTLALYDANDNVIVADMRTTTSCTLAAKSLYNIKYIGADAAGAAPMTPEEIRKSIVIYDGAVTSVEILDVSKYALVDWTLCFYNGADKLVGKDIKMSDSNPSAVYDPSTGVFTYTHPSDFDGEFTEFHLEYTFKYAEGTRADNAGVATGMLRAVRSIEPIMELHEDCKELSIDVKGGESMNVCAVSYFFKVDGDYQKEMTSDLVLVGAFTLPNWTFKTGMTDCPWSVMVTSKGTELVETTDYTVTHSIPKAQWKDGDTITTSLVFTAAKPVLTVTPDEELQDYPVDLVIEGNENCKSGTVAFSGSFVNVDGETVNLPKADEPADALTATIKVKGIANVDVDGSGTFDLTDVRLLRNYYYGGSAATSRGDTTMLSGTSYKSLSGDAKVQKAAQFREAIANMIDN